MKCKGPNTCGRPLVVLSHNHTITSVSRQCKSVCRVGISDSNYATQPPLLLVYWMLICGGNQCVHGFTFCITAKLIFRMWIVYAIHGQSHHLCFQSVQICGIDHSNYATHPPLLAVHWIPICSGKQFVRLIFMQLYTTL